MGGYISVPIGLAAYTSGIPLIIHEQNAVCGLANRLLGPLAQTRLQGFPHTFKSSRPVITTGNPVRQSLLTLESPNKRLEARQGPLRLLVFGGSQGARFLNHVLPEVAALIPEKERPAIYHQCGSSQLQTTQNAYSRLGVNATIVPYIEDMAAAYSWADLVISRAGAMTITEIATAGAASMLVPYPHSRDSHQTANAKQLTDIDAAVMLHEEQFDKHTVAEQLRAWQKNRQRLLEMANNSSQLASTHAAMEMANMCLTYLKDTP
jgi:UDP-N-acetylglucosamine--N-acetylmuramyl-(pentapeptide) pyrophosphoryl-undecaprenol N-acetylglucosamine transferase